MSSMFKHSVRKGSEDLCETPSQVKKYESISTNCFYFMTFNCKHLCKILPSLYLLITISLESIFNCACLNCEDL